jgi:hypothetical protein
MIGTFARMQRRCVPAHEVACFDAWCVRCASRLLLVFTQHCSDCTQERQTALDLDPDPVPTSTSHRQAASARRQRPQEPRVKISSRLLQVGTSGFSHLYTFEGHPHQNPPCMRRRRVHGHQMQEGRSIKTMTWPVAEKKQWRGNEYETVGS